MKFSEKYELLEAVTKGQVRTFLGRELTSKLRVVVHIFDCPGNHSGKMAGQWVLQAFRNLAPSPLGQVLEVGSYEDSSYAYIVTKMPDAAALQAWARAYRVHCGSTEDISRENKGADITTGSLDVKDIREAMADADPQAEPPSGSAQAPGEFTKAFWDLAGKPAEHAGSVATPSSPPSIVAPTSMASSSAEETRPRANAGAAQKIGLASSQQPVGSSQDGFTEAFMRLGEGSLSPSSNVPADSGPAAHLPARMPAADAAAEMPRIQSISQRSTRPEPGAFTKEFLSVLEADPKPAKPREPFIQEVPKDVPKQRSPGAFTREFLMVTEGGEQGSRGAIPSTAKSPVASPKPISAENILQANRREEAGFTNLFQAAPPDLKKSTPEIAPMASNKAATGEFTSFFGGPFQAPVESQLPGSFPDPLQSTPQKQEAGDFTRMFGSLKTEKGKVESLPGSGNLTPSSLEKQEYVAPALERAEPPPSTGHGVLSFERKSVSASPEAAQGYSESWGGSTLANPSEKPAKEPIFPAGEATLARASGPAGATQVFVPRGGDAAFVAPPAKSGPGEFTRIISGGAPAQNLPAEAPIAAPGPEPRNFSMPAMPQIPGMPSPQIPAMQVPAMPAMATPQMPAMPAPQIPGMAPPPPAFSMPQIQLPQAPPPVPKAQPPTSGGKMSYLPLIIIFNVLFIAAVLIVLYFAFKH